MSAMLSVTAFIFTKSQGNCIKKSRLRLMNIYRRYKRKKQAEDTSQATPKKNKYHNVKCEYNGIRFDSTKEMKRYIVLEKAQQDGLISELERQIQYTLLPTIYEDVVVALKTKSKTVRRVAQRAVVYNCDFRYKDADGNVVVEDVKASKNLAALDKAYLLKKKMMRFFHGILIKEVYSPNDKV